MRELGGEREAVFGCVALSIGSRRAALIRAVRGGGVGGFILPGLRSGSLSVKQHVAVLKAFVTHALYRSFLLLSFLPSVSASLVHHLGKDHHSNRTQTLNRWSFSLNRNQLQI